MHIAAVAAAVTARHFEGNAARFVYFHFACGNTYLRSIHPHAKHLITAAGPAVEKVRIMNC